MHLQESGEMYLETIYRLQEDGKPVRSIDVAEAMSYSKPSVSRAVSVLKSAGYINVDKDGFITLTEDGKITAEKTYERHVVLSNFFISIGVPEEAATEDACKIEHHISDVTFEALKKYIMSKS